MYGNPEVTSGGLALKFFASLRLDIRSIGKVKSVRLNCSLLWVSVCYINSADGTRNVQPKGDETGLKVRVKVVKSKVCLYFQRLSIRNLIMLLAAVFAVYLLIVSLQITLLLCLFSFTGLETIQAGRVWYNLWRWHLQNGKFYIKHLGKEAKLEWRLCCCVFFYRDAC